MKTLQSELDALMYEGFIAIPSEREANKVVAPQPSAFADALSEACQMFGLAEEALDAWDDATKLNTVLLLNREAEAEKSWRKSQKIPPCERCYVEVPGMRLKLEYEYQTSKTQIHARITGIWRQKHGDTPCPELDIRVVPYWESVKVLGANLKPDGKGILWVEKKEYLTETQEELIAKKMGCKNLFSWLKARSRMICYVRVLQGKPTPPLTEDWCRQACLRLGLKVEKEARESGKVDDTLTLRWERNGPFTARYLGWMAEVMRGEHDEPNNPFGDENAPWEAGPGDHRVSHPPEALYDEAPDTESFSERLESMGYTPNEEEFATLFAAEYAKWENHALKPWLD